MSPELLTAVQEAIALLESWRGRLVRVEETLARGTGDALEYDRHGCTRSQLAFVVQHAGLRFSGSALSVLGAVAGCDCGHEVSLDALVAVWRLDDGSLARFTGAREIHLTGTAWQPWHKAIDAIAGRIPDQPTTLRRTS